MRKEIFRKSLGLMLITLILSFCFTPQFRHIYALPAQINIVEGEQSLFKVTYPMTVTVSNQESNFELSDHTTHSDLLSRPVFWEQIRDNRTTVDYKLLGVIPLKQVQVDVIPAFKVIAGGQSIGVVLKSDGVLVVGSSAVNQNGNAVNPAESAGIKTGDIIISINDHPIKKDIEVAEIVDQCGHENKVAKILLRRRNEEFIANVTPSLCSETNRYRIGLFVRDSAVGVGTLTFIEPETLSYGALGHVITDSDTNQDIACREGKIVSAAVSDIHLGKAGRPGEKVGSFLDEKESLGTIEKNTAFGIFGKINIAAKKKLVSPSLEIASMNQIEVGPAEILTVVDGQSVDKFFINIEKVHMQESPESKGMVIRVTDERLIAKTGGIIQGMSGSPIIQNGKLVGAVTHVFVHDPTRGYACFMDWMLMEAGLISKTTSTTMPRLFS